MKAPALKDKADKADPDKAGLEKLPKAKLIAMILEQREDARIRLEAKDQQITELSEQLAKLQEKIDKKKARQKIKDINQQVNQPTSKKTGMGQARQPETGNNWPTEKAQKENRLRQPEEIRPHPRRDKVHPPELMP